MTVLVSATAFRDGCHGERKTEKVLELQKPQHSPYRDFSPNLSSSNRITKIRKSNHIQNLTDSNRILSGQIEYPDATESQFKSNRDWDLPITGHDKFLAETKCKRIFKISQHLPQLSTNNTVCFFDPQCIRWKLLGEQ